MLVPPWGPSATESPSAWRCSELCGPALGALGVVSTSGNRAGQDVPGMGLGEGKPRQEGRGMVGQLMWRRQMSSRWPQGEICLKFAKPMPLLVSPS